MLRALDPALSFFFFLTKKKVLDKFKLIHVVHKVLLI